ncbi:5'-methylthioadenosine/adenosylhomocysteine nucleosidase [Buchnera aphidicola (Mindarus keteleerifoliae)]|uniref:5'-methylthioadenosine/adenosylhomocysteine nucleosidase n=1 Tax=Buchnera aphidicola TaxID=9 RepID=UPI0031B6EE41
MLNLGIIVAMKQELNEIKKKIFIYKKNNFKNYILYIGKFKKIKIFLLQCGVGKTNASCATSILLCKYKIDFIINIGSCGSLKKNKKIFDILIPEKLCYHDVDLTAFNYPVGKIPNLPIFFYPNFYLKNIIIKICTEKKIPFFLGLLITGDIFLQGKDNLNIIKKKIPSAIALDMESTAIAHVCYIFNTPFINIKLISDCSGNKSKIEFKKNILNINLKSWLIIFEILKFFNGD